MEINEPTPEKIAEIEAVLKADIAWAVENGHKFDPEYGVTQKYDGTWAPITKNGQTCGVCAIGAHVLRCQDDGTWIRGLPVNYDWQFAAETLGVDRHWLHWLYLDVSTSEQSEDYSLYEPKSASSWALSRRLRAYAEGLTHEV